MSAPKFDKTKPYGTVHGDENGCKYAQGGLLFGANGELHVPPAVEAEAAVPAADMESRIAAAVAAAVAAHAKNTDKIVAAAIGAALAAQRKAETPKPDAKVDGK